MKKIILIFAIAIIVSGCELKKLDWDKFIDENKTDKEVVDSDSEETVDTETPEPDTETPEIDHETIVDEETPDTKNDEIIEVDEDAQDDELIDDSEPIEPDENEVDEDVIEPFCGDGNKDQNEECDLGILLNTGEYGGCNSNCTFAERCGDGIKNGPEICDDGQINGTERFCNTLCTGSTTGAICTGQTKCYNDTAEIVCPTSGDYFGQDAQYLDKCVPRSYSISGTSPQEIVKDNNTQLQWQRTLPTSYTGCTGGNPVGTQCRWQEAINYCDGLNYGGYEDWRLPNIKEINSLAYFGMNGGPSIDSFFFPDTPLDYFWSYSSYFNDSARAWYISFFANSRLNIVEKTQGRFVRCMRGDHSFQSDFEETEINGETIVSDKSTGLIWTKDYLYYSGITLTWKMALDHCATLNYAGFSDWRLPNISELITIIDHSKHNPASNFPGIPPNRFVTSSSYLDNSWSVDIYNGMTDYSTKPSGNYAICVR
ncbi:MAG TPA: DUF1566 domain-containing protein [bacterium]|nr:DUF1566 domain-containing protein [bacterium]HQM84422.1 DUF1566 domain-containing protein [bacterium]